MVLIAVIAILLNMYYMYMLSKYYLTELDPKKLLNRELDIAVYVYTEWFRPNF